MSELYTITSHCHHTQFSVSIPGTSLWTWHLRTREGARRACQSLLEQRMSWDDIPRLWSHISDDHVRVNCNGWVTFQRLEDGMTECLAVPAATLREWVEEILSYLE